MKATIILVVIALVLGFFGMTLLAQKNETPVLAQANLTELMATDKNLLLLDVRTAEEFNEGHIPGAINISHELLLARIAELGADKSRSIVVYCRSGRRAAAAEQVLREAGFSQLQHLEGDMLGWLSAGLEVSKTRVLGQ